MYCQCGCGEKAPIADKTCTKLGAVRGQPRRFINGHYARTVRRPAKCGTRAGYKRGCRCDECKAGQTERSRKWHEKNKDYKKKYHFEYNLKTRYGITKEEYDAIYESQDGCCAICGRDKPLNIDHCHQTGKVRGLLCTRCNLSIGRFNHDPEVLMRASEYLNV